MRAEAEADIAIADLLIIEQDCRTLSRAREIPLTGPAQRVRSLPMRNKDHVRGLPRLKQRGNEQDLHRCEEANKLIDWGLEQAHVVVNRGDGVLLENPRNSWYWEFPRNAERRSKGCEDYDHASCAFSGARAKKQRWRGNVPEIRQRRADCHHVHSSDEWAPRRTGKSTFEFASHEEMEYTAHQVYYLAVQCSIWAIRTGKAKLRLPKLCILPVEVGPRVLWHKLPPSALRADAMPGMGLRLQLAPPTKPIDYSALPAIKSIDAYSDQLPPGTCYVGNGAAKLRLPRSPLAAPYRDGIDGEPEYCLALFTSQLATYADFVEKLTALAEREPWCDTLVVDTPPGYPSHAEALAKFIWEYRSQHSLVPPAPAPPAQDSAGAAYGTGAPKIIPPRRVASKPSVKQPRPTQARRRPAGAPQAKAAAALAMTPTVSGALESHVFTAWRWSDTEVHRSLRKMFPEPLLAGVALPPLEDLVNDPRLAAWRIYAQEHGIQNAPIHVQMSASGWRSLAVGEQRGAVGSKHAIQPVVGFGLGKAEHFHQALQNACRREDPFSLPATASPDLRFAAERTAEHISRLRAARQEAGGLIRELASRTAPLSARLREAQRGHVQRIAG